MFYKIVSGLILILEANSQKQMRSLFAGTCCDAAFVTMRQRPHFNKLSVGCKGPPKVVENAT